jgi:hypothetical protein
MVVSIARHSEGSLAARDTGLFKLPEPRDARTAADSFDETLQCLGRAPESRHYSRRTIQARLQWVRRFLDRRTECALASLGEKEINAFLTRLAVDDKVSSSTQNQKLAALLFLYRQVIGSPAGELGHVVRAKKPIRLPVVAVPMPDALDREYKSSAAVCPWQYIFPKGRRWTKAQTSRQGRHHMDESLMQRAVHTAVLKASITKRASCHTFRHSLGDPPLRERLQHQNSPGASRPQRREDHYDLHPCPQSRPLRSAKPGGRIVKWIRLLRVSISRRFSIRVIGINRA